jgi:hypothetical protein
MHALLTYLGTRAAAYAPILDEDQLRLRSNRFRAVAPLAAKLASLKVDGQANAGPVVDGEGVEVEDNTLDLAGRPGLGHE